MEDSVRSTLLKEKPYKLLLKLKSRRTDNYATDLCSAIDTTYAHTTDLISRFKEHGMITSEKEGRKKKLTLTEEGEELAEQAQKFAAALQDYDSEQGGRK